MLLGKVLVRLGKATEEQVDAALNEQKKTATGELLGSILLRQGVVSEWDVVEALGQLYRVDTVERVSDEMLEAELVRELPVEWARSHHMLPVRWKEQVGVLIADLSQVADQSDLRMLMHTELVPVLTVRSEINRCIEACYFKRTDSAQDFIRDLDQQQRQADQPEKKPGRDDLLNTVSSAPVTQLVNLMLLEAVRQNASDIHLEPRDERLRVRYRIDGRLYEQAEPPKHMEAALISRLKVMGQLDIAEKRLPQDGMATVHIGQREVDIRISTIPVAGGERVVLRLLNTEQLARPLSDLGMPPGINAQLELLLQENRGAVWVTGPTGSGKNHHIVCGAECTGYQPTKCADH